MKIHYIKIKDHATGWELEPLHFNEDLTLLVGASGVGKTRILEAIMRLKDIADGKPQNGLEWEIEFDGLDGERYQWKGEYEDISIASPSQSSEKNEDKLPKIKSEEIKKNDEIIVQRGHDKILFQDKYLPKLTTHLGIIFLLKEEELIKPLSYSLLDIFLTDPRSSHSISLEYFEPSEKQIYDLDNDEYDLRDIPIESEYKLSISYFYKRELFEQIKERYIDIFPFVEDIRIMKKHSTSDGEFSVVVQIQEAGQPSWIDQKNISSGMLRTLFLLAEIYLCSADSVILIDEFENSLGVNCINDITDEILASGRNIQFILTSHHPYIINNIDFKYWKIVSRKGPVVTTHTADEYKLGNSKHEAFLQLINLEAYLTGVDSI